VSLTGPVLEDTATPLVIDLGVLNPGELAEVTVSGLAEGTTLSAGVVNPDGSVTLSEADLLGLTVTALDPGTQLLNVDVTVTDPATGTSATTSELLSLEVLNVADVPLLD
ncbi:hypothetical protein, partial [Labrenzia sp. C1B70]|uniref:hypothetical protein n=1 Tax=Labrenzia sp. C1B70 TaxID=1397531 RepID=UPI000562FC2E